MPRVHRRGVTRRSSRYALDADSEAALLTGNGWTVTPDRDTLQALWRIHGPKLLKRWIDYRPGTRPWAWHTFDSPGGRNEGESETAFLHRIGELGADEMEAVTADWRRWLSQQKDHVKAYVKEHGITPFTSLGIR